MISKRGECNPAGQLLGRVVRIAFIFLTAISLNSTRSEASTWQVESFLKSIHGTELDLEHVVKGLRSINSIDFEIEPVNKYERFFNRLILNSRLGDGAGRLKTIDLISSNDLDTLIHESFHAYKANFIELKKDFSQLNTWMKNRAHIVYSKYSKEKSEMALEEAYAVFIGSILSTKMKFAKNILSSSSSQHCSQRLGYLERLWTSTWNAKTQGYYYRDGIGEYWADTAKGLWVLITEGRKAYADIQNSDGAIYMENELPKLDKEWIAARFLDGKVQVSFKETFKDELKKINCYEETR